MSMKIGPSRRERIAVDAAIKRLADIGIEAKRSEADPRYLLVYNGITSVTKVHYLDVTEFIDSIIEAGKGTA